MGDRFAATAECVANRDELVRTAFRLLIINVHRGLWYLPPPIRQSEAARQADQAISAASEFFNQEYDCSRIAEQLDQLCAGLTPLARAGYNPFRLLARDLKRDRNHAPKVSTLPRTEV
jgi:hypothetical protein